MEEENLEKRLTQKIPKLNKIEVDWCDFLRVKNEKFKFISLLAEINDFNYITNIILRFYAENPPGYIFTTKISVNDFFDEKDLKRELKAKISLANSKIAEAIRSAAQISMFN